jgi:hypothetical protein
MSGCLRLSSSHDGLHSACAAARSWRHSPLPVPRPMTQRFRDGLPANLRWKRRGTVPLAAGCMRSCAMARTRISRQRFTPMASNRPGVANRDNCCRASSCPTTTSTTPMRLSSWSASSTRDRAACAIIKHANPCGVAVGDSLARPMAGRWHCDQTSAFGGIIALQPARSTRNGDGNRQAVHRSHHCPGRQRGSTRDPVGQEEPAPDDHRWPRRPAPARA